MRLLTSFGLPAVLFKLLLLVLLSRATHVSAQPAVLPFAEAAVLQVHDPIEASWATGFVIGHDASGWAIALTNEHAVESGSVKVYTWEAEKIRRVEVLYTCTDRDLALLRMRPRGSLEALPLAARNAPNPDGASVVALRAVDAGLETYHGVFDSASTLNNLRGSSEFFRALGYVPQGSSGGPVLAANPATGDAEVVGVTARGTDADWSGPSVESIYSFLDEAQRVSGPITLGEAPAPTAIAGANTPSPALPVQCGSGVCPSPITAGRFPPLPAFTFPTRQAKPPVASTTAAPERPAPGSINKPSATVVSTGNSQIAIRQSSGSSTIEVTSRSGASVQVITVGESGVSIRNFRDPSWSPE